MRIPTFLLSASCLLLSLMSGSQASVKIYVQNIEAYKLCANASKQDTLANFIAANQFDFILTQEYEGICDSLFNRIRNMGYSITAVGDSTVFYKNKPETAWTVHDSAVDRTNITWDVLPGKPTAGERNFNYASLTHVNSPNIDLCVGTAHLCIPYPGSNGCATDAGKQANECKMSTCVLNQTQAHARDICAMAHDLQSCSNLVVAGDLNAYVGDEKTQLTQAIESFGATNIQQLNGQAFDMGFYKGANISNMKYSAVSLHTSTERVSDHDGFILEFDLK